MSEPTPEDNPYRKLPEPVHLDETVAVHDAAPPADPNAGRDTETEFMLRYGGV
jgi:hypothetical protein